MHKSRKSLDSQQKAETMKGYAYIIEGRVVVSETKRPPIPNELAYTHIKYWEWEDSLIPVENYYQQAQNEYRIELTETQISACIKLGDPVQYTVKNKTATIIKIN